MQNEKLIKSLANSYAIIKPCKSDNKEAIARATTKIWIFDPDKKLTKESNSNTIFMVQNLLSPSIARKTKNCEKIIEKNNQNIFPYIKTL